MTLKKFLVLGLAGLAFTACSKDEDGATNTFEGTGAVSVKIVNPAMTRSNPTSGTSGTSGSTVAITGDITVTLEATNGGGNIKIDASTLTESTELKFWNVSNPTKITVSINGGINSYSGVSITETTPNMQALPASIPAYGETSTFTLTSSTGSPNLSNTTTEYGATTGDDSKTYQMYEASVTMEIPVARLEVSGITHVTHTDGASCKYSALTIGGVYLDGLYATGDATTITDYIWATGVSGSGTTEAILKDAITDTDNSFLSTGKTWPTTGVFAYNFYAGEGKSIPVFKIYFPTATASDSSDPVSSPRYAIINKYIDATTNTALTSMENGHIYRITSATLSDDNIIGDESGNTLYGVEVTVTEAVWTVTDITAEWASSSN